MTLYRRPGELRFAGAMASPRLVMKRESTDRDHGNRLELGARG